MRYDVAFRRQAALTGNTRWSTINPTLYTMCFWGRAAAQKRCELCFATTHSDKECAQRSDPDPEMKDRLNTLESALLAWTRWDDSNRPPLHPPKPSGETCRKWNTTGCTLPRCRHSHTCSTCGGDHPAYRCTARQAGSLGPRPMAPTGGVGTKPVGRPY